MKRWLIGFGIGLVVLGGAIVVAARVLLDPEVLGKVAVEQAESALGRDVELSSVSLVLLPPALDLEQLRIGGAKPGDPDFATIGSVRLRVSLLPLLTGTVSIAALEITEPKIRLDVDDAGIPVPPTFGAAASPSAPVARPEPDAARETESGAGSAGSGISLVADRVSLVGGQVVAGDLRVEGLDVSGRVSLEGTTELAIRAELPGIGRLSGLDVTIDRVAADDRHVAAAGEIEDVDLGRVAKLASLVPDPLAKLDGRVGGSFRVDLLGSEVTGGGVSLVLRALSLEMDDLQMSGEVPIEAKLGGPLRVNLAAVEITKADAFRKPAGDRLAITGQLPATLPPKTLALQLQVPGSDVDATVDIDAGRATLAKSELDLAPLAPWILALPEKSQLRGKLAIPGELRAGGDPLEVRGELALDAVTFEREGGPAVLSGRVVGEGARVTTRDLVATIGGEAVKIQGGYDLRADALDLEVDIPSAKVEPMLMALAGKSEVTGVLGGKLELRGPPDIAKLTGSGQFDVTNGEVRGFSLLEQVIGDFAIVAQTAAASRGRDLSRYNQETFDRMGVRFSLAGGVMKLEPVVLEYRYGKAELRGDMQLVDSTLDLRGDITLTPQVTSDLIGKETTDSLVISGCGVRGAIDDPKVSCDRKAMAAVIARVGLSREIGDRLDEKLGPGGAKAVEGLIDGIFGGRKKK